MQNRTRLNQYVTDGAGVVPQPRLLVMLYDRLVLDLEQAEAAMVAKQIMIANDKLIHAQSIIHELNSALNVEIWDGAANLKQLYIWFNEELVKANLSKDPKKVRTVLRLITQLQDAWHQAYEIVLAEQAGNSASALSTSTSA